MKYHVHVCHCDPIYSVCICDIHVYCLLHQKSGGGPLHRQTHSWILYCFGTTGQTYHKKNDIVVVSLISGPQNNPQFMCLCITHAATEMASIRNWNLYRNGDEPSHGRALLIYLSRHIYIDDRYSQTLLVQWVGVLWLHWICHVHKCKIKIKKTYFRRLVKRAALRYPPWRRVLYTHLIRHCAGNNQRKLSMR